MAENNALINLGSVQAPYQEFTYTIPAGESQKVDYIYSSFNLLAASVAGALKCNFGGAVNETLFSAGMGYKLTAPVQFLTLFNTSNSALTVTFALAIGDIYDNRLTVSGNIMTQPAEFDSFTTQELTITAGTATAPAGAKVILQNTGANVVYIGGTGTDGLQLQPQGTFEYNSSVSLPLFGTDDDTLVAGVWA